MDLIDYTAFAALRMSQFWPPGTRVRMETDIECAIGVGDGECVGFCHFLRPRSTPGQVAEIRLEAFGPDDCPEDVAVRLFSTIGLPLRPGISIDASTALLGEPLRAHVVPNVGTFVHYRCGASAAFRVNGMFTEEAGLGHIVIVRDDMYGPW